MARGYRTTFGFGSVGSILLAFLVYLVAKSQHWTLLEAVAKWYIIIVLGFVAIVVGIIVLSIILLWMVALRGTRRYEKRVHTAEKKQPRQSAEKIVDAQYTMKKEN